MHGTRTIRNNSRRHRSHRGGRALAALVGFLGLVGPVALSGCGSDQTSATTAAPTDIGAGLTGTPGLRASVYAEGLTNASAFAVDPQGRLWVVTAAFSDAGDDAAYFVASAGATPTKVISDLHTPLGLLWIDDTLLVSTGGDIDAYTGFDGTAFAEHHTLVDLPDGAGQTTGLVQDADGRIWTGVSAPCNACEPATEYTATVLSFLPDGTDLQIEATGIRAPVGLAIDRGTDDLYVTMNQRDDLGDDTPPDWLAIVKTGQDWGFPECAGEDDTACEGVPSPVAALDTHAAVSGVAVLGDQLAPVTTDVAVVAEWATGKVLAVDIGSDAGAVHTLIEGIDQPVGVGVGPGGGLLVASWGSGTVYAITPSTSAGST